MKFKAVLIDIDDTLFSFQQGSFDSLVQAFGHFGVPFTSEVELPVFERHNVALWQAYERGEIPKEYIFAERFRRVNAELGLELPPTELNRLFLQALAQSCIFMPHCRELLEALHGKYKVYVVTNGDTFAQESRIARSGLGHLFDGVFISEQMGCKKPEKVFFDKVFARIGEEYRDCSILVGDSLTSDMQGGRNAGIPTCFYGDAAKADDRCDYVIGDLLELLPILEKG